MTIEVGIALTIFGLISGAFWRMWALIKEAGEKGDSAQRELLTYQKHVAETYVTKQGQAEQTAQLLRAIENIGNRIDSISERLDRAFERPAARRSS